MQTSSNPLTSSTNLAMFREQGGAEPATGVKGRAWGRVSNYWGNRELMQAWADMGNEVSAGEGEPEEKEEEDGWTSREDSEVSGGLWALSHELADGQELCLFTCSAASPAHAQLCRSGAEVSRPQPRENNITSLLRNSAPAAVASSEHRQVSELRHFLESSGAVD